VVFLLFYTNKNFSQEKRRFGARDIILLQEDDLTKRKIERKERQFILEHPIDEKTYLVGPGDALIINLWGEEEDEFEVMVMPEGNIIIPNIGSFRVNGMILSKIKEIIKEKAKNYYPQSEITVSLGNIRTFKIHITGEVIKRGTYNTTPVDRLSYLISSSDSATPWADKKNIEIRHLDGTTDFINLLEFENKGDLKNNPFLRAGDIIYVPRLKPSSGMIFISGNIVNPGYQQYYENETVGELIKRIQVIKETTDWENAIIKRGIGSDKNKTVTIPLNFTNSNNNSNNPEDMLLENSDYIYLPKRINEVYVSGAVRAAGAYPYHANMRSSDYVGLAGKTERAGSNSSIKVFRNNSKKVLKGGDVIIERGDTIEIAVKRTEIAKDYLALIGTFSTVLIAAKAVGIIK